MTGAKTKQTKRLGELLVAKKVITPTQLDDALAQQRTTGEFFGELLVRQGIITESQLLNALSEQFEMPRVSLGTQEIDWDLASRFPPSLLIEHCCFPYAQTVYAVTVAIANPLDAWTISELERSARGRKLELVLATPREIGIAARRHYEHMLRKLEQSLKNHSDGD